MALIIVLSVFNGFEGLVLTLFNSFNPDIQITSVEGKKFSISDFPKDEIKKISGVAYFTEVIEENALLKYGTKQYIATIKGVSSDYPKMTKIDSMISNGSFVLEANNNEFAVVGQGISYALELNLNDFEKPIKIFIPRKGKEAILNPMDAFNTGNILASGIFSIQQDFDTKYVIVPIKFARKLVEYNDEVTSIEIGLLNNCDKKEIQDKIKKITGNNFKVKNRFEQQELLYKIMKSEKWAIFFILSFILIIATFNIIGSLTMLIIEKKSDISILSSLGAKIKDLRNIFLLNGILITLIGAFTGIFLGFTVCILQIKYGFVKIQSAGTYILDSYPVEMHYFDFIIVFATVFIIGLIATWYSVKIVSAKIISLKF